LPAPCWAVVAHFRVSGCSCRSTPCPSNNIVKDPDALKQNLMQLASVGVAGIMGDVWWGIVERAPRQYDFSAYLQIVEMIAGAGLKYQVRAWRR
jgi:hypothetical protein